MYAFGLKATLAMDCEAKFVYIHRCMFILYHMARYPACRKCLNMALGCLPLICCCICCILSLNFLSSFQNPDLNIIIFFTLSQEFTEVYAYTVSCRFTSGICS